MSRISLCATACALSAAAAFGQTYSSSDQSGSDGSNRTESRTYLPGESYYEANLARGLAGSEQELQRQFGQTNDARQRWWYAFVARKKALQDLAATRASLTREYHESPELVAARKDLAIVDRQYQVARAAVLQQLIQRKDYREVVMQRQDSAALLREQADQPLTSPFRRKLAEDVRDATERIQELEDAAIRADSVARTALQERQAAMDYLAGLQSNSRKALASDQRLTSAKQGLERTQRNLQLQQRTLAANWRTLAQMQQGYQRLVQQRLRMEDDKSRNSYWPILPTFWPAAGSFPNGITGMPPP